MTDVAKKEDQQANEDLEIDLEEGGAEGSPGDEVKKKPAKKKLIIIIAACVLVLGASGGGAAFFLLGPDEPKKVEVLPTEYVTLEPIVVDLAGKSRRVSYIKLQISVGISGSHKAELEKHMPMILDSMKTLLRDKTRRDLQGQAGTEELRGDLIRVIGNAIKPAPVETVLFKDILVQ